MVQAPSKESLELYLRIMEEIKARTEYINHACIGKFALPVQFAHEFCFLQLRMVFELIALGCLCTNARHADLKTLEKLWNANELITRLGLLNSEFFPKAVTVKTMPWGFDCFDFSPPPMTKEQFLRLYGRCGEQLHRGSLRKLARSLPVRPPSFTEIREILKSLVDLLNVHRVPSPDLKTHYICNMINGRGQKASMISAQMQ